MIVSLLMLASSQASAPTDFGVRMVGGALAPSSAAAPLLRKAVIATGDGLGTARRVGAQFGRVTSTWRSPDHNRRVGGARNSWHLQGRAIDIARRSSVRHGDIAAELRRAGLYLIESLDEGDHSHFAFSTNPLPASLRRSGAEQMAEARQEAAHFRFVVAPRIRETRQASTGAAPAASLR